MSEHDFSFEDIFKENERRIHYHINRLRINDPHEEFFQEGLYALWSAYREYSPNKGPMSTYFNFIIRNRLIDLVRRDSRTIINEERAVRHSIVKLSAGNRQTRISNATPLPCPANMDVQEDTKLWQTVRSKLTERQWKWVYYYIIKRWSLKEIADKEDTTVAAVKGWRREACKKLATNTFHKRLLTEIQK